MHQGRQCQERTKMTSSNEDSIMVGDGDSCAGDLQKGLQDDSQVTQVSVTLYCIVWSVSGMSRQLRQKYVGKVTSVAVKSFPQSHVCSGHVCCGKNILAKSCLLWQKYVDKVTTVVVTSSENNFFNYLAFGKYSL